MKRIIIGRGIDCDIVIPDEKDNVSRHHLVITFNLLGKMKVSDTSANGTYINGNRMLKGASIPVTKDDKIRLGDNWILDWNLVKDPYKGTRIGILIGIIILILAGIGVGVWCWHLDQVQKAEREQRTNIKPMTETDDQAWNSDSTSNVAPKVTSINVGNQDNKNSNPEKSPNKKAVKKSNKIRKSSSSYKQDKRPENRQKSINSQNNEKEKGLNNALPLLN